MCVAHGVPVDSAGDAGGRPNSAKLLDKLFGRFVEPELVQPTLVTGLPQALSPLAASKADDPYTAQR